MMKAIPLSPPSPFCLSAALLFVAGACVWLLAPGAAAQKTRKVQAAAGGFGRIPALFIAARGQAGEDAKFLMKSAGGAACFSGRGVRFDSPGQRFEIRFEHANPKTSLEGIGAAAGRVNFLVGSQPQGWITGLPAYEKIAYRRLYPGIDLVYSSAKGALKSEFIVSPGSDPAHIRISYAGLEKLHIDERGALILTGRGGTLREERPEIFEEEHGVLKKVEGGFELLAGDTVGFRLGPRDPSRPLIIDPLLSYSTYLGGSGQDIARAIAVDGQGYAYVAGQTDSANLPPATALQPHSGGGVDAFVAKLSATGNQLVYCTYLGGSGDDRALGIAVDGSGNAFVTGWTYSSNFPVTSGTKQQALAGGRDAFVAKLNPAGSALVFSTYLGGAANDQGNAIAVDGAGNVYTAGETYSANFPVVNGFQSANQGRVDAFAAKLRPDGAALLWSTYLGGYGDDRAVAIAVDGSGATYITGGTTSTNFPTYLALQPANAGGQDAFVSKLNADGRTLGYSTYLGGSGGTAGASETGMGIKVDAAGNAYIAGITSSRNFPVASAAQAAFKGGATDAFVTKFNASGSALSYSTYLGGSSVDYASAIAIDAAGVASVGGYTASSDFPVANALQAASGGGYDAFVTQVGAGGNTLESSSYWGGSGDDAANAIVVDASGSVWVAGQTLSTNFPLRNALQSLNPGGISAFVALLREIVPKAAFRSRYGEMMLSQWGATAIKNAGGYLVSDLAIAQNDSGDAYVVGINDARQVWMNVFQNDSQSWKGWVCAGSMLYGSPAVAAVAGGGAYVVARASDNAYYINRYDPASGFQGWSPLGGGFVSDPTAVSARDGSIYVAGRTSAGPVWAGRYVPGSGFQGWVPLSVGAPVLSGKPAVAVGSDAAAYIAARASDNSIWMARFMGNTAGAWFSGGGTLASDPDLAAVGESIYAAVVASSGGVYVQPFLVGVGNGWQGWSWTGGSLVGASIASSGARYSIVGKNSQGDLWWYRSGGTGWTYLGYTGWAANNPAASPK